RQPVDREAVVAARTVAPRGHPAGVAERLQVPRDGALRQRERVAQLGHGQLDAVEDGEQPAAGRGGEQRPAVEDRRATGDLFAHGIHPSIRIIGYPVAKGKSTGSSGERKKGSETPPPPTIEASMLAASGYGPRWRIGSASGNVRLSKNSSLA